MSLKNKSSVNTIVFALVFVALQIIDFTIVGFRLVDPFWLMMIPIVFYIAYKQPIKSPRFRNAYIFMLISAVCSFMSVMSGSTIGECMVKSFMAFMGYAGLVYLSNKELNVRVYCYLILGLYVYSYFTYFRFDEATRKIMDGDLFGHSSSNTIAMYLNVSLWILYVYIKNNKLCCTLPLMIFSFLNVFLIVIQGSRAGIIVSLLISVLVTSDYLIHRFKLKSESIKSSVFFLLLVSLIYYIATHMQVIEGLVDVREYQGISSYEEDVRSAALIAYFQKMDMSTAILGMPNSELIIGTINRTFNAFVDFWRKYTIFPFIYLICLLIMRIIKRRQYTLSILDLSPLLLYSLVESIWGGTLWDMLIYITLFYKEKANNKIS